MLMLMRDWILNRDFLSFSYHSDSKNEWHNEKITLFPLRFTKEWEESNDFSPWEKENDENGFCFIFLLRQQSKPAKGPSS